MFACVRPRHLLVLLTLAALLAGATPALASGLDLFRPLSGLATTRSGAPAAAVRQSALARSLSEQTGLSPAQVAARSVCPATLTGLARCGIQTLVVRSSGHPVRPRVTRGSLQRILRGARARSATALVARGATALVAPAQAAPGPGTPAYLQQAYDLAALAQTAGGNQTIAIVDAFDDATAESDLATYRSTYGLPPCTTANGCFAKVNQSGQSSPLPGPDPLWNLEESLDLDAVSALCPNCHILLIEASDDYYPELEAAMNEAVTLHATEISASFGYDQPSVIDFGHFPVPVVAGTGDSGYWGAGDDSYPAALPDVTAAGGTSLAPISDGSGGRGFAESAWSGAGSGCDVNEDKPAYQTDDGCSGRSYADVSADADPYTGLNVVFQGQWEPVGGTSLATPLIAAFDALTGVSGPTPQWAYQDSARLNDPQSGSNGGCSADLANICQAGPGFDGPTGEGSISGAVVTGAPGIGGPTGIASGYANAVSAGSVDLVGGVYPNGLDTHYWWEYGPTTSYGQTSSIDEAGSGTAPATLRSTLANLSPSTIYHYRLVAANSAGTTYGYDYTFTTAAGTPPQSAAAPAVSGDATQGATLSATPGSWNPAGSITYQWQRSTAGGWQDIPGATTSTYTTASADAGTDVRVLVADTTSGGQSSAASDAVGPVTVAAPAATTPPQITGVPTDGQTLSATTGGWDPDGALTDQWMRCDPDCQPIAGATGPTYTLQDADVNTTLQVVVTATDPAGTDTSTSAPTALVSPSAPVNLRHPRVTGSIPQGNTLTADPGTWAPAGTLTYQWQRCDALGLECQDIAGATASTYTTGYDDDQVRVRVVVTATNSTGQSSAASNAFGPVGDIWPTLLADPAISGDPQVGSALTVTSSWSTKMTMVYQWQRCTLLNSGCQNIAGATAATYTPSAQDAGSWLSVDWQASNSQARVLGETLPVGPITQPVPVNVTSPKIDGSAQVGQSVSVVAAGTWTGVTEPLAYQWQDCDVTESDCQDIPGATGTSYTIADSDRGSELRVREIATDEAGSASEPSNLVGPVPLAAPINTALPRIDGTPTVGTQLTSDPGTWDDSNVDFTYEWQRCDAAGANCQDIPGATASTYTLTAGDVSALIRITVTVTNSAGQGQATSAAVGPVLSGAPRFLTPPSISASPVLGQIMGSTSGDAVGYASLAYQWQRCDPVGEACTDIDGATSGAYTPVSADLGGTLRLVVTATNSVGATQATALSGVVTRAAAPAPVNTVAPRITGTPAVGAKLTSDPGAWDDPEARLADQWERCDAHGQSCTDIAGATAGAYTPVAADAGHTLRLVVTATNSGGSTQATALSGIVAAPPAFLSAPTLVLASGAAVRAMVGEQAKLSGGRYTGQRSVSVQWYRCTPKCTAIGAAASSLSHTLGSADAGSLLRAKLTLTGPGGTLSSWATGVVGPVKGARAAGAQVSAGQSATVTTSAGTALAGARASAVKGPAVTLALTRARTVRGPITVWACAVASAAPDACTTRRALGSSPLTLTVATKPGERVDVVALAG